MGFKDKVNRFEEKKRGFEKKKEKYENTNLAGALRSGRIDPADELRAALQGWVMRLEAERDKIRIMKDMFNYLRSAVERVIKNAEEYQPSDDDKLQLKYWENLRKLLEKASFDEDKLKLEGSEVDKITDAIEADSELLEKFSEEFGKSRKPAETWPGYVQKRLGINKQSDLTAKINRAKREEKRLGGSTDRSGMFEKAVKRLKGDIIKELKDFRMDMLWLERDTTEHAEKSSKIVESGSALSKGSEADKRKHYKKLGKTQKSYAKITNEAIDTLIDIRESVDSDKQIKVITPRDQRVYLSIQKITKVDLVKEAEKELAESAKTGRTRSDAVTSRG